MNPIDENRAQYDTLVLGYLKDNYGLVPQDKTCLTDCEPVRKAHEYAKGQLLKAEHIPLHLLGMARAIAAKPK